jgi:hypothetical protein
MVLVLPAALVNFLHHEIPQEALMNDGEIAQYNQNLQVGFVHLPESLEMDPGLVAHSFNCMGSPKSHPNSVHIWGRHLAPLGNASGPQVP